MYKLIGILLISLFLGLNAMMAQDLPANQYDGLSLSAYSRAMRQKTRLIGVHGGMSAIRFTFPEKYFGHETTEIVWVNDATIRVLASPLQVDFGGSYGIYRNSIDYTSLDLSVCFVPYPLFRKPLKRFQPYLGVGHDWSIIYGDQYLETRVKQFKFVSGVALNLHKNFYLDLNYQNSFPGVPERNQYRRLSLSMGLRGNPLKAVLIIGALIVGSAYLGE